MIIVGSSIKELVFSGACPFIFRLPSQQGKKGINFEMKTDGFVVRFRNVQIDSLVFLGEQEK
jgi:hypothetical protein